MGSLKIAVRFLWVVPHAYAKDSCGYSHLDSLKITLTETYAQVSFIIQWIPLLAYYRFNANKL